MICPNRTKKPREEEGKKSKTQYQKEIERDEIQKRQATIIFPFSKCFKKKLIWE